ncbi:SPOR domain-containing protein [Magnetococcus sp. PR-3]|uniref:SPOR domain-containing protein n=1 Tax=Magnetococcus sp. PR-3 TaxID=3120355 RepID=UPI002FCE1F56
MSVYRTALACRLKDPFRWFMLALVLVMLPIKSMAQEQPAFITNAYFADKLEVKDDLVKPNTLVSVLPAQNPGMVGYFVMDVLLAQKGKHMFEIDIVDGNRRKVADMAYDPVQAMDTEHIYTVVGSVAGSFPPGWLYFKVYDRFNGGPRIHISTFSIMAQLSRGASAAVASAPAAPAKPKRVATTKPSQAPVQSTVAAVVPKPAKVTPTVTMPVAAPKADPIERAVASQAASGQYVRIGAEPFGHEKAQAIKQQVSDLGLPVSLEAVSRGYQVLSGPYSRNEAAEFARRFIEEQTGLPSRIKRDGENIQQVQPKKHQPAVVAKEDSLGVFAPKTPVKTNGPRYMVALGSFGNQDNAKRLEKNLAKRRFAVSTEQVKSKGRTYIRVFVGPYADRQQAKQSMQTILAQFKISGVIQRWNTKRISRLTQVAPASAPVVSKPVAVKKMPQPKPVAPVDKPTVSAPVKAAKASKSARRYAVQVVSYRDQPSAKRMEKRLMALGLPAYQNLSQARGRQLIRLFVGPYQSRAKAEAVQGVIKDEIGVAGSVIRHTASATPVVSKPARAAVQPKTNSWQAAIKSATPPAPKAAAQPKNFAQAIQETGETPIFSDTGRQDYTVYAGFFSNQGNATRLRERIESQSFPAFQRQVLVRGKTMNSVCAGPFTTRGKAEQVAKILKQDMGIHRPIIRDASFSGRGGLGCGPGRSR